MNFFRQLNLRARINFYIMLVATLVFFVIAVVLYQARKSRILYNMNDRMMSQIDDLKHMLNRELRLTHQADSIAHQLQNTQTNAQSAKTHDSLQPRPAAKEKIAGLRQKISNLADTAHVFRFLGEKKYLESGQAYLIGNDGKIIWHRNLPPGFDLSQAASFKTIKENQQGYSRYFINPDGKKKRWRYQYFDYFEPLNAFVVVALPENELFDGLQDLLWGIFITLLLALFLIFWVVRKTTGKSLEAIVLVVEKLELLSKGKLIDTFDVKNKDEIHRIVLSLNKLIKGLQNYARFSEKIKDGELETSFTPLSHDDMLGNSLLKMRESLKNAQVEERKRRAEDEKRNWATHGLAKFGEILREYTDLKELSYQIVSQLVGYVEANQGGIFLLNQEKRDEEFLELMASYAYNRRKYHTRRIEIGEGLIGACFLEKKTTYLTEIPEQYIEITSGLGKSTPRALLIVPLIEDEKVLGVLEMAAFKKIEAHKVEFVEKIAESIASTLDNVIGARRTKKLVQELQQQSAEKAEQEEEMRQNIEELQATQEEALRNQTEMQGILEALESSTFTMQYDMQGNVIEANQAFADLLETTREKLTGLSHRDGIDLEKAGIEDYQKFWSDLKNGNIRKLYNKISLNNKTVWLSETYTPIKNADGKIYKVLKIAFDITETKLQAEKQQNE